MADKVLTAMGAVYHLVAFRGLRRGEARGARWVDGELEEGVLMVAGRLSDVGRRVEEGKPKSRALDSGTLAVLQAPRVGDAAALVDRDHV